MARSERSRGGGSRFDQVNALPGHAPCIGNWLLGQLACSDSSMEQ